VIEALFRTNIRDGLTGPVGFDERGDVTPELVDR